jgi:hypothetical protein
MATFTLDHFRAAAEAKYGSTDIDLGNGEILSLVNPLRLPKEKRETLSNIQERANEEGADQGDVMREAIRIVASDAEKAERFLAIVGDDLAMLATVFTTYTEGAQVGEASASQG